MVFFSVGFWYICSPSEYSSIAHPEDRRLPLYKAIPDSLNPWDIIAGVGRLFTLANHLHRTGGFETWFKARKAKAAQKSKKHTSRGAVVALFGAGRQNAGGADRYGQYEPVGDTMQLAPSAQFEQGDSRYQKTGDVSTMNADTLYQGAMPQ